MSEDYYTWGDSFWYLFGYTRLLEVEVNDKVIHKRHLLHKQISHTKDKRLKLKTPEVDMLASYAYDPTIKLGKVVKTSDDEIKTRKSFTTVKKKNKDLTINN